MADRRQIYLHVFLPRETRPVPCAAFLRQRVGSEWVGTFGYARSYLARADALPLDPLHLPLGPATVDVTRQEGFPGAVRDSMPDHWGQVVINHRAAGEPVDAIDYLLRAGDDRVGAVVASETPTPPVVAPTPAVPLDRLLAAADALLKEQETIAAGAGDGLPERLSPSAEAARRLAEEAAGTLLRTSQLGGARPKALLADEGKLWLAKFPRPADRWNDPLVEAAMLTLAAKAGIPVPAHRVVKVGGRSVLLVERFDRGDDGAGGVTRARYLSALTLLDSEDTASMTGEWSYPRFADQLGLVSATPDQCRRDLFRRLVFNACISNEDDHPRNHAVIAHAVDFALSPAYDLTPRPQHGRTRQLAMQTGYLADGTPTRLANAAAMLRAAPRFGRLTDSEARSIIHAVRDVVHREWEPTILASGGTRRDVGHVQSAFCPPSFWDDWSES